MVIGVTGGIGCGKSTVLTILKDKYNCFVIEADVVAHKLMLPYTKTYTEIVEYFGDNILNPDDTINRQAVSKIIFEDSDKLTKINSIVHPAVKRYIVDEIANHKEQIVIVEAALLIEAGYTDICDELWYIYADIETRIKRLAETRGYSRQKVEAIINNQLSDFEFRKNCDKIIDNSNSLESTLRQINDLLSGGNYD